MLAEFSWKLLDLTKQVYCSDIYHTFWYILRPYSLWDSGWWKRSLGSKIMIVFGKALDNNHLFLIQWKDDIIKETVKDYDLKKISCERTFLPRIAIRSDYPITMIWLTTFTKSSRTASVRSLTTHTTWQRSQISILKNICNSSWGFPRSCEGLTLLFFQLAGLQRKQHSMQWGVDSC